MMGAIGLLSVVVAAILFLTILPPILVVFAWFFGVVALGQEVGERFTKAIDQDWSPVLTIGFGTFLLVFFICSVVVLFVATGNQAQFGSDFAVVGLVHALLLFGLIVMFGVVSGGHFNPAVTLAAAAIRRIEPLDALVYILAQLSGGVLGALMVKGFLLDEGRATNYGNADPSALVGSNFQGMLIEAIGTFLLVAVILAVAMNPRARQEWAPLAIGTTLVSFSFLHSIVRSRAFRRAVTGSPRPSETPVYDDRT